MKKKIISILLACFIFISSSVSCFAYENKNIRFADGGIISAPMVGVIATLAVASGIVINSNDDIVNIASVFYHKNKDNWTQVNELFNTCVSIGKDKLVTVGKEFKDLCFAFFDNLFSNASGDLIFDFTFDLPTFYGNTYFQWSQNPVGVLAPFSGGNYAKDFVLGSYRFNFKSFSDPFAYYNIVNNVTGANIVTTCPIIINSDYHQFLFVMNGKLYYNDTFDSSSGQLCLISSKFTYYDMLSDNAITIPYSPGLYNPGDLKDFDNVGIYVPGNLGDLVGNGVNVFNPSYDLPIDGVVSVPSVSNPSISIDSSVSIPNTGLNDGTIEGNPDFSFPSFGDSINFEPLYATGITEKFPFSLPWDIQRIIGVFNVKEVAPKFTVPLLSEKIELDLTKFNDLAAIVRFFVLISFIICLVFISTRLIG